MRNISKVLVVIAVLAAIAIVVTVSKSRNGGGNSSITPRTNDGQTSQPSQVADSGSTSKSQRDVRLTLHSNLPPRPSVIARATNATPMPPKTTQPGVVADWDE